VGRDLGSAAAPDARSGGRSAPPPAASSEAAGVAFDNDVTF
jgi:hypothetical protein